MTSILLKIFVFITLLCSVSSALAEQVDIAPEPLQVALFVKLLAFHQGIQDGVSVHVIGNPSFARELKKVVGVKIGKSALSQVTEGDDFPAVSPTALYLANPALSEKVIRYTREKKVLSITGLPDLIQKGISLGVGISGGKPRILLNISASKEENISWDHTILKVSTTF